ncbi:MAG: HAMP domain-containing sensor histidine kinase [Candidatus Sulfotelmatobacter sp.]|jgi:signal transduction histidine kinase
MRITSRRGTIVFFLCLGIGLVALAVALNVGWIILNWREGVLLFFGIIFFAVIIAGMIVNTTFLLREIRRNEQHDSFINAVTHELKTPVASIRLHLETLQRRDLPEAQRQEFYRLMLRDTDRLTDTVEQVLRAGRAGDKKAGKEKVEVDFRQVVRDSIDVARTRHSLPPEALRYEEAGATAAEVNTEGSNAAGTIAARTTVAGTNGAGVNGTPVRVQGSAEDLRTAVLNLLDNAIKYSGENVDVRVRLETPDEKHVVLSVQDQGVGISADDVKLIFRRFYRVSHRSQAHVKGTGLGLFIVKAIAQKHGGKVFAESEGEGQGTTVTLQLPRMASPRPTA